MAAPPRVRTLLARGDAFKNYWDISGEACTEYLIVRHGE